MTAGLLLWTMSRCFAAALHPCGRVAVLTVRAEEYLRAQVIAVGTVQLQQGGTEALHAFRPESVLQGAGSCPGVKAC